MRDRERTSVSSPSILFPSFPRVSLLSRRQPCLQTDCPSGQQSVLSGDDNGNDWGRERPRNVGYLSPDYITFM